MIPIAEVYRALNAAHGPQEWWPAEEGAFEIMVGALLVQRTTWRSAETAIAALKAQGLVDPGRLRGADLAVIETCIKSAGFYRTKAARLRNLATFVTEHGGVGTLAARPTPELRALLLGLDGVGPETADAILLYAFERPAVVVDAYLRRLVQRLAGGASTPQDMRLRAWVEDGIAGVTDLNEFHALVVAHGKQVCRPEPRCGECPIGSRCRTGRRASRSGSSVSG
ncbi:MAG TPA: endonuclease [Gammaproteobacteria bacterium]|nr:endonuclease [Gammaproteobacteria bacterium]